MELRSIKYFLSTYEIGTISGAARKCFVSQPSITAAIQQLESVLKVSLFVRHARGVLPTPAAKKLYPIAKEMSENEKSIISMFSDGATSVPLRLGIMRSLGAKRMSYLLKQFTKRIDNVELTLVDPDEPCDARIVLSQTVLKNEKFVDIWQDNYQLALPKNWLLAHKKSIALHDLDTMPFINRVPCYALEKLTSLMTAAQIHFQPRANIRTIEYASELVSSGIGAALLPDWQEIQHSEELTLKPIKNIKLAMTIGLAYKTSKTNTPLISDIIKVCKETRRQELLQQLSP